MTPPTTASTAPVSPLPYRLELGGGYTSVDLGLPGQTYSGGHFEARIGQSFFLHPQHSIFLNGVFRYGALQNPTGADIDFVHFGLETGYEAWLAPDVLSAFVFTGLGTNIFYSQNFDAGITPTHSIANQSAMALTLGGGLTLGRGILVLSGGWQPNFGLQIPYDDVHTDPPAGLSPHAYFFNAGLNLTALSEWLGDGIQFPRNVSFTEFLEGIKPGFIADTTYTLNFGGPADRTNHLRVFDHRSDRPMANHYELNLERPTSAEHPFGFRFDFGVGEDAALAAPREGLRGDWFYLQQLYAALRLPWGRGVTLRAGQCATPIGAEVIEGPLNNQISRSFLFNYAIPFTHTGVLAEIPFSEEVTLTTGAVHGWDNVVDHNSGIALLSALAVAWDPQFSTTLAGTLGDEGGRFRSLLNFLATYKPNEHLSLSAEYDWGREASGAGSPAAQWHALALLGRYDINEYVGFSARGEVFGDPQGARTGDGQTLGEFSTTFHVNPWPWMRLRMEYRHDQSTAPSFLAGTQPVRSQDTLGLGLGMVF